MGVCLRRDADLCRLPRRVTEMAMKFSRRHLMQGAAALGAASAFGGRLGSAFAQAVDKPAVLVIYMGGGYNALFSSADSFAPAGSFGMSSGNIKPLGNGLVVDNATFGTGLSALAQANMAAIGVNHGISSH